MNDANAIETPSTNCSLVGFVNNRKIFAKKNTSSLAAESTSRVLSSNKKIKHLNINIDIYAFINILDIERCYLLDL